MHRAALLAVALLAPLAAAGGTDGVRVHMRVEGAWAHVLDAEVELPATYTLVASNSGRTYTLDARTPLAALVLAAREAGLALEVSDEYADFVVKAVAGETWYDTKWWDYRVDWVEPNYGAQAQWLAWGPPLIDGAEVLWYVDQAGMTPLRMAPVAAAPEPCADAVLVETPAIDVVHQPGQPWPQVLWKPVPLARLAGAVQGPVVAGVGAGFGFQGDFWAEEQPLPVAPLVHYIRSQRAPACG